MAVSNIPNNLSVTSVRERNGNFLSVDMINELQSDLEKSKAGKNLIEKAAIEKVITELENTRSSIIQYYNTKGYSDIFKKAGISSFSSASVQKMMNAVNDSNELNDQQKQKMTAELVSLGAGVLAFGAGHVLMTGASKGSEGFFKTLGAGFGGIGLAGLGGIMAGAGIGLIAFAVIKGIYDFKKNKALRQVSAKMTNKFKEETDKDSEEYNKNQEAIREKADKDKKEKQANIDKINQFDITVNGQLEELAHKVASDPVFESMLQTLKTDPTYSKNQIFIQKIDLVLSEAKELIAQQAEKIAEEQTRLTLLSTGRKLAQKFPDISLDDNGLLQNPSKHILKGDEQAAIIAYLKQQKALEQANQNPAQN